MQKLKLLFICAVIFGFTIQAVAETSFNQYTGTYAFYAGAGSQREISVTQKEGNLIFHPARGEAILSVQDEQGVFHLEDQNTAIEITFVASDEGAYDSFSMSTRGRSRIMTRTKVLEENYHLTAGQVRPHALSDAVLMGDVESAKKLIAAGVDVGEHDTRPGIGNSNGRRPLNWAALKNNTDMINLLLDAGAGINLTNYGSGFTPLHHAAEAGALEAAVLLIEKGADPSLANDSGYIPLDIATIKGHEKVYSVIQGSSEK